jgi:hypothetical protein
MSAVLTPRRSRRGRDRDRDAGRSGVRQESLFGAYSAPAEAPAREPRPESEPQPERGGTAVATETPVAISGPTLDELVSGLWGELLAGDTATCPACGTAAMQPRHSAGAGVVGGRCGACDATLA